MGVIEKLKVRCFNLNLTASAERRLFAKTALADTGISITRNSERLALLLAI